MSYYSRQTYKLSSHVIRRFSERTNKKLSMTEIEEEIYKMLDDTYEGNMFENGDKYLICFSCPSSFFIVTKDNVVKTFINGKY